MGTDPSDDALVLEADLNNLSNARDWTRGHAERAGFTAREVTELELLVTEAVSNIIRHGYQGEVSGDIELCSELHTDQLVLRVVDRAPTFDPTKGDPVDLSEPRPGGYGLYLLETLTDHLSWRRREDGANELTMARFRPERGGPT